MSCLPGDQADGGELGMGADDGAHNGRAVAVVFRVVSGVDRRVRVRGRLGEDHVTSDATGPDASVAAGLRPAEPGVAGGVGGAHVGVVTGAHHPDGHVAAPIAVETGRGDLQLRGVTDAGEVLFGPGHVWSKTSLATVI